MNSHLFSNRDGQGNEISDKSKTEPVNLKFLLAASKMLTPNEAIFHPKFIELLKAKSNPPSRAPTHASVNTKTNQGASPPNSKNSRSINQKTEIQENENKKTEIQENENKKTENLKNENQKNENQKNENQKNENLKNENQKNENQKNEIQENENLKTENQKTNKKTENQENENKKTENQKTDNQKTENLINENLKAENKIDPLNKIPTKQSYYLSLCFRSPKYIGYKILDPPMLARGISSIDDVKFFQNFDSISKFTFKQILNIACRFLCLQYARIEGFIARQTYLDCIYIFKNTYKNEDLTNRKVRLMVELMKNCAGTMKIIERLANQVFTARTINTTEWNYFSPEELIENSEVDLESPFMVDQMMILANFNSKSYTKSYLKTMNYQLQKLVEVPKKSTNFTNADWVSRILNIAKFQLQLFEIFLMEDESLQTKKELNKNTMANSKSSRLQDDYPIKPLDIQNLLPEPDEIDDEYDSLAHNDNNLQIDNPSGFVDEFLDFENKIPGIWTNLNYKYVNFLPLNSRLHIKNYKETRFLFQRLKKEYEESIKFVHDERYSKKRINDISRLLLTVIEWSSTHTNTPTLLRFFFFRRIFTDFDPNNWQSNKIFGTDFEDFIKGALYPLRSCLPNILFNKIVQLFGKFFSITLRLVIFKPEKALKSISDVILVQWSKNIWQIIASDQSSKEKLFNHPKVLEQFFKQHYYFIMLYYSLLYVSDISQGDDELFVMYGILFTILDKFLQVDLISEDKDLIGSYKSTRKIQMEKEIQAKNHNQSNNKKLNANIVNQQRALDMDKMQFFTNIEIVTCELDLFRRFMLIIAYKLLFQIFSDNYSKRNYLVDGFSLTEEEINVLNSRVDSVVHKLISLIDIRFESLMKKLQNVKFGFNINKNTSDNLKLYTKGIVEMFTDKVHNFHAFQENLATLATIISQFPELSFNSNRRNNYISECRRQLNDNMEEFIICPSNFTFGILNASYPYLSISCM